MGFIGFCIRRIICLTGRRSSELRLETEEELRDWREKRRVGKVRVTLDREHLDLGSSVLGIGLE